MTSFDLGEPDLDLVEPGRVRISGQAHSSRIPIPKGNVYLKTAALVEAANAAARTQGTYLRDKFLSPQGPPRVQNGRLWAEL